MHRLRLECFSLKCDRHSRQDRELQRLHAAALAVNARDLTAQGLSGPQIGEALAKARIRAIAAARSAG